jgi:hypothetical protein
MYNEYRLARKVYSGWTAKAVYEYLWALRKSGLLESAYANWRLNHGTEL